MPRETRDETHREAQVDLNVPTAGVIVVFSEGPRLACAPFDEDGRVRIGRDDPLGALLTDDRLSRHHAEIFLRRGAFGVRDLGSRNGTAVDGNPLKGEAPVRSGAVVRAGGTILVVLEDIRPYLGASVEVKDDRVCGPQLALVLDAAERARDPLCIVGETGSGKEVVAHGFHAGKGPFVAVNCATIQEGLAERILFGARRGAFSGATADAAGLVQSADGGVLFLDEVDELAESVQAKLLRVVETQEVLPIGATAPQKVRVRFCLAAQRDLRSSKFRPDLYYRIRAHLVIPPLRERPEEIPYLVQKELAPRNLSAHPKLVETCLLRTWPGNVRELLAETRVAADAAQTAGERTVRAEHLRAEAGNDPAPPERAALSRDAIERALGDASGNISAAARALGLHRTQLKRAMAKLGL